MWRACAADRARPGPPPVHPYGGGCRLSVCRPTEAPPRHDRTPGALPSAPVAGFVGLAAATAGPVRFQGPVDKAHTALIYLLVVLAGSVWGRARPRIGPGRLRVSAVQLVLPPTLQHLGHQQPVRLAHPVRLPDRERRRRADCCIGSGSGPRRRGSGPTRWTGWRPSAPRRSTSPRPSGVDRYHHGDPNHARHRDVPDPRDVRECDGKTDADSLVAWAARSGQTVRRRGDGTLDWPARESNRWIRVSARRER